MGSISWAASSTSCASATTSTRPAGSGDERRFRSPERRVGRGRARVIVVLVLTDLPTMQGVLLQAPQQSLELPVAEVRRPSAAEGEAVVEIHAAAVNRS